MGVLFFLLYFAFGIVQILAVIDGFRIWFGWGTIPAVVTFLVASYFGPIGNIFLSIVGYVGVTRAWGWEWWQAILLCFPFVIFSFLALGIGGFTALIQRMRENRGA